MLKLLLNVSLGLASEDWYLLTTKWTVWIVFSWRLASTTNHNSSTSFAQIFKFFFGPCKNKRRWKLFCHPLPEAKVHFLRETYTVASHHNLPERFLANKVIQYFKQNKKQISTHLYQKNIPNKKRKRYSTFFNKCVWSSCWCELWIINHANLKNWVLYV